MTPLEILKAARAKIEKLECWGKGSRNRDRPMATCCAAEAIEEACPVAADRHVAIGLLKCAAGIGDHWGDFIKWNDAPERTHAEVIAAYNLAIALARNLPAGGQS